MNVWNNRAEGAWRRLLAFALIALLIMPAVAATAPVAQSFQSRLSDVAIVTTENGQPFYDACFVLLNYSNEGCDVNRDGKITFEDIPHGSYTLRQTKDLGSARHVPDSTITVTGAMDGDGWERFDAYVVTSDDPGVGHSSGAVDIALITRDPQTGRLLTGTCYVLVGYSNVGCDENGDGQVTFAAIPYGVYSVRQTLTPAGYLTINDYTIEVEPVQGMLGGDSIDVPLGFIVKQSPLQNAPDTRNVSVVLIDSDTLEKVVAGVCVELVGASLVGCDEDLRDGQIDFLDVRAGGPYELRFTNLPPGAEVGTIDGPLAVTIDSGIDAPSNQMVFVLLDTPDSGARIVPKGSGEVVEIVGDDGFTIELDGVSVSGDADVAPIGSSVRAQSVAGELSHEISGFAEPVGDGVEITLGDGIQPNSPLTITFAPDAVESWGATSDAGGDLYPVVFVSKPDGSGMEMADAQMLPDGSVEVIADHLSTFLPALVSINQFMDWFGDEVLIFSESRSRQPDCATRTAEDVGWVFSAPPGDLLWLCAQDMAGNGVLTTFTNNGPLVWRVSSAQATPGLPKISSIVGETLSLVLSGVYDPATTTWLFPPDGSTTFETIGQHDEIQFNVVLDKNMNTLYALLRGLLVFSGARVVEKLGQAECFVDFVPTWFDTVMAREAADLDIAGVVGTVMSCMASVMSKLPGAVISALATLPGALAAPIEEWILGLIGRDAFTVTLTKLGSVTVTPIANSSGHGWPTGRDDSAQGLYVWIGANSIRPGSVILGMPDWVACDDERAYCLLGYDGEDHVLLRIRGFEIIGTIADWYPNPKEALLILGMTERVADQILGI